MQTGLKTGIIATDETKDQYADGLVLSIGSREEEETIAHHLYGVLRDFDEAQVNVIYSEGFLYTKDGSGNHEPASQGGRTQNYQDTGGREMIALGCDHGGYELKQEIIKYLEEHNLEYTGFRM